MRALRILVAAAAAARGLALSARVSRAQTLAAFDQWYADRGGASAAILRETDVGWGLVAERDVRAGDAVCTTPRALIVCAEDAPAFIAKTRDAPGAPGLSEEAVVVARLMEVAADPAWAPYVASLPSAADLADVPCLWPEIDAKLLAGTYTGRCRSELLERWRGELAAVEARAALADPDVGDVPWEKWRSWERWRYWQACLMSRAYNVEGLGYALMPCVDMANHDDLPSLKIQPTNAGDRCLAVSLVATRDAAAGEQLFNSYAPGGGLDALVMLQAFGWLPLDESGASLIQTCSVDVALALRRDDPLAEAKLGLLETVPGGGRIILTLKGDAGDAARRASARDDCRMALRMVEATEDEVFDQIAGETPEASPWALGQPISPGNERRATDAGSRLLRRAIKTLDNSFKARAAAARRAGPESAGRARLAHASADGERAALLALLEDVEAALA